MGSIDYPLHPLSVAVGAEATFVARTQDTNTKHFEPDSAAATAHKGTAFVEIYQNCVVFNPTAWDHTTDSDIRDDNILYLEDGKPLLFGKDRDKGIRMNGLQPEVVNLSDVDEQELIVHNESEDNPHYAYMLSRMEDPHMPLPFGVLRSVSRPTYDELLLGQVDQAVEQKGRGDLEQLFKVEYLDGRMIGGEIKTAGEKERIFNGVLVRSRPSLAGFFGHAMKKDYFNHKWLCCMHIDCRPTRSLRNAMGRSAG